jgi:hypothetical protein
MKGAVPRGRWLAAALAWLVLAVGIGAYGAARPDPAASARAAGTAPGEDAIADPFKRFALNALLATLIDDAEPLQWTDVGVHFFCGPGTLVTVNGVPLVPGALVPASAFAVRWQIDQCWPLDYSAFELSGQVELHVAHEDTGLRAVVHAQRLRIATSRGSARVDAPFTAWLALHRPAVTP